MEREKKEKLAVHLFSNMVIFALIVAILSAFLLSRETGLISTANSEYNGTIYAGDRASKKVSLMINVYWGTEHLEKMLNVLKKNDIKTTFFVGGSWVCENTEVLKRMREDGHEIGSHGYSHKEHGKLDYDTNYSEIKKCHDKVKEVLGIDMELFAPPGGSYNKNTTEAAKSLGYKTIMWTRDTIDWRDHDTSLIFSRAVVDMKGGDLILMHPTANTAEALEKIIEYAKNHGLFLTTVSDTLGLG